MRRLILFDIDGTLTKTSNGYLPFNDAVLATFGVVGDIRTVVPDGNTDPRIVEDIFVQSRVSLIVSDQQWRRFEVDLGQCYLDAIATGRTTIRPLPGVVALFEALNSDLNSAMGVVTGNFATTAQVKLEAAGLAAHVNFGAYASDSAHRPDLPRIAKQRWERRSGRTIDPRDCVIVGDTPKDLAAARKNEMKCLLVGTGRYPVEELALYSPDACVADLTDTAAIAACLRQI